MPVTKSELWCSAWLRESILKRSAALMGMSTTLELTSD